MKGSSYPKLLRIAACLVLTVSLTLTGYRGAQLASTLQYDAAAESDYRRLRFATFNAVAERTVSQRFFFAGQKGPFTYPALLMNSALSPGVRAHIVHETKPRAGRAPLSLTRLEVFHPEGQAKFILSELDGLVIEQIVAQSRKREGSGDE